MSLKQVQKDVWQNKLNKGFNTTDVNKEFCLLYGEVAEAYDAYKKKKDDLGEELADIAIYLLSISEMLGFDLKDLTIGAKIGYDFKNDQYLIGAKVKGEKETITADIQFEDGDAYIASSLLEDVLK